MEIVRKFRYFHPIDRLIRALSHEDDYDVELTVACNQYKVRHILSECSGKCNDCQYYNSDYKFNDKKVLEKNIQEKIMYEISVLMDRMKDDLPIEKDLVLITKDIDGIIDEIIYKINIIYKNDDIEILSAVSLDEIDNRIKKMKLDYNELQHLYFKYRRSNSDGDKFAFSYRKYCLEDFLKDTMLFLDNEYKKMLELNKNLGIQKGTFLTNDNN